MTDPIKIIQQHQASISDAIEDKLWSRLTGDGNEDVADFALRECACGEIIEDFYAYNDHLVDVLDEAIT